MSKESRALPAVTRGEIVAWAMFDFANSSYTTIVVSFFFSTVFTRLIAGGPNADLWWGWATGSSNLIVLLLSPFVGAVADESGRKKSFLFGTYALCVGATAALWLVQPGQVPLAFVLFVLSNLGFSFGENFAGAFLPEISTPENVGRVSGFGWGLGYFGGLASLALVFPLVRGGITLDNYAHLRLVWPVTAVFFLIAAVPTFAILRERTPRRSEPLTFYLRNGFGRLGETLRSARTFKELVRFLSVFFVYSIGLTAIIAFFGVYSATTLGFTPTEMVLLGALLQIPSALGAFLFGVVQDRLGARRTLQISLLLWLAVSATTAFTSDKTVFWVVAMVAGLGIGSLQSASRAMVGLFSPVDKAGEFFGLWGLAGKGAYAVGPLLFGLISSLSGSQRVAALANGTFFLLGLFGLFLVDEQRGRAAAAAWNGRADAG